MPRLPEQPHLRSALLMEYQFRCPSCGRTVTTNAPADTAHCPCGNHAARDFSFGVTRSIPEHFNQSVGAYVSNERQLRDALKVASEEASYRIGMEHNYEYLSPADMADAGSHGVTDDGLEDTRKAIHDASR